MYCSVPAFFSSICKICAIIPPVLLDHVFIYNLASLSLLVQEFSLLSHGWKLALSVFFQSCKPVRQSCGCGWSTLNYSVLPIVSLQNLWQICLEPLSFQEVVFNEQKQIYPSMMQPTQCDIFIVHNEAGGTKRHIFYRQHFIDVCHLDTLVLNLSDYNISVQKGRREPMCL